MIIKEAAIVTEQRLKALALDAKADRQAMLVCSETNDPDELVVVLQGTERRILELYISLTKSIIADMGPAKIKPLLLMLAVQEAGE